MIEPNDFESQSKKKRIIPILLVAAAVIAAGIGGFYIYKILQTPKYKITGKIIDAATEKPLKDIAVVLVSNGEVKLCRSKGDGTYSIEGVAADSQVITEVPIEYDPILVEADFEGAKEKGESEINLDIELPPSLLETTKRVLTAIKDKDHGELWQYLHIDDKNRWGEPESYEEYFIFPEIKDFEIDEEIKELDTWKHQVLDREYPFVSEVSGKTREGNSFKLHFQNVDGFWYLFSEAPIPQEWLE